MSQPDLPLQASIWQTKHSRAMLRAFDPDLDGRLGLAEYMAMTLFLRSQAQRNLHSLRHSAAKTGSA